LNLKNIIKYHRLKNNNKMLKQQNGIVYKILCNITGEAYIGSTFRTLAVRMNEHKNKHNDCASKQIIKGATIKP
jgi:hypothetical protein